MKENIRLIEQEPQRLLFGACRAYKEALYRRILFMFDHESRPATMLLLLAAVGLMALWRVEAWRPYASCFTLIAAGILLSIPFAPPWDAAERPFAATLPLEALFSGIGLSVLLSSRFFARREEPHDPASRLEKYCLVLLVGIVVLLTVSLPLLHCISSSCEVAQESSFLLLPGSFVTVTAQHWDDFYHRLTPFLNHYPAEKAFFSKLPEQPKLILGIDWKEKNFDHCALLEGVSEVTSYHYWLVDQRLLKEIEDHAHHE
jgi:hypothetical protein